MPRGRKPKDADMALPLEYEPVLVRKEVAQRLLSELQLSLRTATIADIQDLYLYYKSRQIQERLPDFTPDQRRKVVQLQLEEQLRLFQVEQPVEPGQASQMGQVGRQNGSAAQEQSQQPAADPDTPYWHQHHGVKAESDEDDDEKNGELSQPKTAQATVPY